MKPEEIDYIKILVGIIGVINTVLTPILITWLKKNFTELKNSKEEIKKMREDFDEETKHQKNQNEQFKNSIQKQSNELEYQLLRKVDESITSMMKDIDRKIELSNYELDKNRKEMDGFCSRLVKAVDVFDTKLKDSNERLKGSLVSKDAYYRETSKFKDEFLRELLQIKTGIQHHKQNPTTFTELFHGMDSFSQIAERMVHFKKELSNNNLQIAEIRNVLHSTDRSVEKIKTDFVIEKDSNNKKHNLSRRLLSTGLNDRKQIDINLNKLKVEFNSYKVKTDHKLKNYNRLLEGFKKIRNKNENM